ncbi:MAG: hypothetical protein EXX96DRAFT_609291 [Benjaminiella poitrasii]|nr:MAG: hypothetical protein EXX96DRAFT_609291 [Benjaminiella poitrasii]
MSIRDWTSSPLLNGTQNIELTGSSSPFSRVDSFDHQQRLEKEFCRDFFCCGLLLGNLHELLEHYEEFHLPRNNSTSNGYAGVIDEHKIRPIHHYHPALIGTGLPILPRPVKQRSTIEGLNMLENAQRGLSDSIEAAITADNDNDDDDDDDDDELASTSEFTTVADSPRHTPSLKSNKEIVVLTEPSLLKHESSLVRLSNSSSSDASVNENIYMTCLADRPYRCHIENCDKAYKNANGLKYHRIHGHIQPNDNNDFMEKPFICLVSSCRKCYKNLNGLKYHMEHSHMMKVANLTSDMFLKHDQISLLQPPPQSIKRKMDMKR